LSGKVKQQQQQKNCYTDILNNCRDFIWCLICWIM